MPTGALIVQAGRVCGRCVWSWLVSLEEAVPIAITVVKEPAVPSVSSHQLLTDLLWTVTDATGTLQVPPPPPLLLLLPPPPPPPPPSHVRFAGSLPVVV